MPKLYKFLVHLINSLGENIKDSGKEFQSLEIKHPLSMESMGKIFL